MYLKRIDDEQGFTYTLEAIIGVFLIIGTVVFMTGNLPYTAQKTGEHSKVQLMNIGRDMLDLLEVTRVIDVFGSDYLAGIVYRNYTLVADKKFVAPGENVTFTVYKLGLTEIAYVNLTLEQTVLGLKTPLRTKPINGTTKWSFPSNGTYNIRAYEGDPDNPTSWTNYVTISVGYYYLETDVGGISDTGSKIVEGVVYNSSGLGIPNLTIQILDYQYNIVNTSAAWTSDGKVIEDFENATDWTSDSTLASTNTYKTQGDKSLSVNGTSNFWIQRTNSSGYNLDYYDILSFDFYSPTSDERKLEIALSNNSSSSNNKFTWKNISVKNSGWNKINLKLTDSIDTENLCCHPNYPKLEGNMAAVPDVDTINITVSNITANEDYLFDNLTVGAGRFLFTWSISGQAHTYYIQAVDSSGNISNRHRIVYSNDGYILSNKYIITEGQSATITLTPGGSLNKFNTNNNFNINQKFYNQYDPNKIYISDPIQPQQLQVTLTANTSGDYYIFYGNVGQGSGDPAAAAKSNTILIQVLPLDNSDLLFEDMWCAGFNGTKLSQYMRRIVPQHVNYNLYLIKPEGTTLNPSDLYLNCIKSEPVINGYPTDEAVTVNKILHMSKLQDGGNMAELRMVLWYK